MNRMNYKKTFLLGFGFFAISITWSVYNSFMPKLLGNFISSSALIGFFMTVDNYFALLIQPTVGIFSDRLRTPLGRRMPFVLIGMPLAVVFTFLIPQHTSLLTLVILLVSMNLSMSLFRSPVIALMPDITHRENRSKANSIINFMGGIGSLLAFFVGSLLWDLGTGYPFYLAAGLMLVSCVVLLLFIREKRDVLEYEKAQEKVNLLRGLQQAFQSASTRRLLLAICLWFMGFNGIETFFTRYGEKYLGIAVNAASLSFSFISLSFLVFAIPAGLIATRFGKRKTISVGLAGLVLAAFGAAFLKSILLIRILFLVMGLFWALININSYPLVAEMAPEGYTGTYTGLYYLFSSIAAIVSPPLLGGIMDLIGYQSMFFYSALFFLVSLLVLRKCRSEEQSGPASSGSLPTLRN